MARAAHNHYLARVLDQFFGLSQRLWYLAMPEINFLPQAVDKHLELLEAIKDGEADRAQRIMQDHVRDFYDQVKTKLEADG